MSDRGSAPLRIQGVSYGPGEELALLRDVDLMVREHESVAVLGASGSGKSTLLGIVLGLIRPDRGVVSVQGRDVTRLRGKAMARLRNAHLGVVFQDGELLPELTPEENVALPALWAADRVGFDPMVRARELLDALSVPAGVESSATLSGGERQRVAIARALINEPTVLLADEPTGSLDPDNAEVVADLLFSLPRQRSCCLVVVTHDRTLASRADRVVELVGGRLRDREKLGLAL